MSSKRYLLDTNVLSEGSKRMPNSGYLQWIQEVDDSLLYTSCLVLGEGLRGVLLIKDAYKRKQLNVYWHDICETFAAKSMPIDTDVAILWAQLSAACAKRGRTAPYIDLLLAAQALTFDMTLVSRNIKDFEQFKDLNIFCPWT